LEKCVAGNAYLDTLLTFSELTNHSYYQAKVQELLYDQYSCQETGQSRPTTPTAWDPHSSLKTNGKSFMGICPRTLFKQWN